MTEPLKSADFATLDPPLLKVRPLTYLDFHDVMRLREDLDASIDGPTLASWVDRADGRPLVAELDGVVVAWLRAWAVDETHWEVLGCDVALALSVEAVTAALARELRRLADDDPHRPIVTWTLPEGELPTLRALRDAGFRGRLIRTGPNCDCDWIRMSYCRSIGDERKG